MRQLAPAELDRLARQLAALAALEQRPVPAALTIAVLGGRS